jgi:hypothetical protein
MIRRRGIRTPKPKRPKPAFAVSFSNCPHCRGKHIITKCRTGKTERQGTVIFHEIRCDETGQTYLGREDGDSLIQPQEED